MKLFPLIFITAVICQIDASTVFGRMTIGWPRRPTGVPVCTNPPCSTPSQLQSNRFSNDCLLCNARPCPTCWTAQLQSFKQCPPCVLPPCPPCANQYDLRSISRSVERGREATAGYPSALGVEEPSSDDCTPLEIETAAEELVHKAAAILPNVCLMRKSSLLPPFHLIDIACPFRGAGVLGFIRHHLPELIEYFRRHSFLSEEGFLDKGEDGNTVVIPYSSRSSCRRHISSFLAVSSPGLQNNQEPGTTLPPEDSSVQQPVTKILRH